MSNECRTLDDMSPEERAAIERRYSAKIVESGQDTPVDQMSDVQLLMRASSASFSRATDGRNTMARTRRLLLKDMGLSYSQRGQLSEVQRETLREIVRRSPAPTRVSKRPGDRNTFATPQKAPPTEIL